MAPVDGVAPQNLFASVSPVALSVWIVADPVTVGRPWMAVLSTELRAVASTTALLAEMLISVASTGVPAMLMLVPFAMNAMS
jgi:hypothetical protein